MSGIPRLNGVIRALEAGQVAITSFVSPPTVDNAANNTPTAIAAPLAGSGSPITIGSWSELRNSSGAKRGSAEGFASKGASPGSAIGSS